VEPEFRQPPVAIARIVRTRGNRGEVLAELHTDFPSRFGGLDEVWLQFPGGHRVRVPLVDSWEHQGRIVLKFAGIDTISAAEALIGAWVQVDASEAVPLPEGTYYYHDLIGCSVLSSGGEFLGTVADVERVSGSSLLVVKGAKGQYLVPAVAGICKEVRIPQKIIVVDLPAGLMDLNE